MDNPENAGIPDVALLVDDRLEKIWQIVNDQFTTLLIFHTEPNYRLYSKNKIAIIYVTDGKYSKDFFAHEVLHLYLETKHIQIGSYLTLLIRDNPLLSDIFSPALREHISNTLDHIKMWPLYLALGFDRTQFLLDYDTPKCTVEEISLIRIFLHSDSTLQKTAADCFLGKFFGIKACPNDKINYGNFLDDLNAIDTHLFQILDDFWEKWLAYDINNYHIRNYNYWALCDELCCSLEEWARKQIA